jgi:thiol-disulfide isomerase/thioredoxin
MTMRPGDSRIRAAVLKSWAAFLVMVMLPGSGSLRAQDSGGAVDDRFSSEPDRPKAESPVAFSRSWDDSRAEAKRSGRRLLAYFTSEFCGWCRALEKRTLTDAEVVALSKDFVCVEVDVRDEKNLRVADEFRIDSIPRTIIFTPDGAIIDRRTGYIPALEYAAWLKGAGTTAPAVAPEPNKAVAPAPVGAPAAVAKLVIWFVDGTREIARWSDSDWTNHAHLLRLLHAAGIEARAEHIAREDFPARWDAAVADSRVPDLISPQQWAGLVRQLDDQGRFTALRSERLTWMTEVASCPDFKGRWLYVVNDSEHPPGVQRAVEELLRPAPAMSLPGAELSAAADQTEAARVARAAVVAYISGDAEGVKRVAASSSPQLTRCTRPEPFRRDLKVETGAGELRGNDAVAFAKIEMRFHGKNRIGGDPVLVVLQRQRSHWKAFSVSTDLHSIRALPALSNLRFRPPANAQTALPSPRLLHPGDGGKLGEDGRSFAWEISDRAEPPAAQVCEVLLDDKDCSWPLSRIKVFDGEPSKHALLAADTAKDITGLSSHDMRWCVWSIGADGRISASDVRRYRGIEFKY